jgi:hypothetical protein
MRRAGWKARPLSFWPPRQRPTFLSTNQVIAGQIIECADDAEARAQARQYVEGGAVELWQDARLVLRLEACRV